MTILAFSPVPFYGTSRIRKESQLPKYVRTDPRYQKRPAQFELFSSSVIGKMFANDFGMLFYDIIWSFVAVPKPGCDLTELLVRQEVMKVLDEVKPDLVITFTRLQAMAMQSLKFSGQYRNEHFHCDAYLTEARHEFIRHLKGHIHGKTSKSVGEEEAG